MVKTSSNRTSFIHFPTGYFWILYNSAYLTEPNFSVNIQIDYTQKTKIQVVTVELFKIYYKSGLVLYMYGYFRGYLEF